jgi:hypothetical protein
MQKPGRGWIVVMQLSGGDGRMADAYYTIEKATFGWVVRVDGEAVLICRQKKTAINTARYAGRLMFLDGEISECDVEPSVDGDGAGVRDTAASGAAYLRITH